MASATFVVTQVGPHTSIQDRGRPGLMRFGVPASGAIDRNAFQAANTALGNPDGCPAIEISLGGITLECLSGSVTFAVTGGAFQTAIDASPLGSWWVETIHAGSKLTIKPGFWGSWAYLAFAGHLQATSWLGSVSTHGPSGLGGGRIAMGQKIVIENTEVREDRVGSVPCPVFARPRKSIRVVLGPQDRFFAQDTIATLLSQPFALSDAYDRMGVRLNGPSLKPSAVLDMPSQAIVRGSIQVAGDGVPTVLLADHQTTGGYPKIATVISGDVDQLVQLRSRRWVTFDLVTPEQAIAITRSQDQVRRRYLLSLSTRDYR